MPLALADFAWLAILFLCIAFVWCARKLLAAMFQSLINAVNAAHIPYLGGYIHDGLGAMEQAIDSALGGIEHGLDSLIGASWHRLAELTSWLWRELKSHAALLELIASYVAGLGAVVAALRALVHDLARSHSTQASRVRTLERELHGIDRQLRTLEREVSNGIGHDVLPRLKTLDNEVARITDRAIPAIQAAESDAASAISNLYDWARGKAALLGVGTFTIAVAAALDALGLGGLRCPSFLSSLKNRGCGLWNGLEDMLGLLVDVALVASICDVLPWLTKGVDDVGLGMVETIHAAGLSACSGSYPPPPPMPAVNLSVPTVYGVGYVLTSG